MFQHRSCEFQTEALVDELLRQLEDHGPEDEVEYAVFERAVLVHVIDGARRWERSLAIDASERVRVRLRDAFPRIAPDDMRKPSRRGPPAKTAKLS